MKSVVLVGATDGIGLELARLYVARGWRVGILGRNPEKLASAAARLREEHPCAVVATGVCDVRHHAGVETALDKLLRELGQMDLFVYCAAVMIPGAGVSCDAEADLETLDANASGAVHLLGLAANYCRLAGRGQLAAIGSVAGDRGRKGNPAYSASKAALHTYLEGLRNRLHPYGVRVTTVKPGFVRTRMLSPHHSRRPSDASRLAPRVLRLAIDPSRAARLIARGLDRGREVFYVPAWWALVAFGVRHTPRFLFKRFGPA